MTQRRLTIECTAQLEHLLNAIIQDSADDEIMDDEIAVRAAQCSYSDKQQAIHWLFEYNFPVPKCLYKSGNE